MWWPFFGILIGSIVSCIVSRAWPASLYASAATSRQREALCYRVFHPAVRALSVCSSSVNTYFAWRKFNETCDEYSSCEWELLKRLLKSEVKGQGRSEAKCTFRRRHIDRRFAVEGHLVSTRGYVVDRILYNSGVARILKLGGTPVMRPEGPMREWGFGGGAAQRARSPSARRSGESCHYLPPSPPPKKKISSDFHESCGHACRRWGGGSPCTPVATLLLYNEYNGVIKPIS